MEYTSSLETLEGLSNAFLNFVQTMLDLGRSYAPWWRVRESQILLMVVNKAPGSLYFDS